MKRICLFAIVLTLLLISGCAEKPISTEVGDPVFGSFSTVDIKGDPVDETVFSGRKLTMVNIWATFCGPCIGEMPALAELSDIYGEDFQVIGIVVDAADLNGTVLPDKKAEAVSIIETTGANYRHLLPSSSLNQAYLSNVQAVPETIFVDENGNQVGQNYLGAKSLAEWKTVIESTLESLS